jgi:hypothetical protein
MCISPLIQPWEGLLHVSCQFVLASTTLSSATRKKSDFLEAMLSVAELVRVDFAVLVHVS